MIKLSCGNVPIFTVIHEVVECSLDLMTKVSESLSSSKLMKHTHIQCLTSNTWGGRV